MRTDRPIGRSPAQERRKAEIIADLEAQGFTGILLDNDPESTVILIGVDEDELIEEIDDFGLGGGGSGLGGGGSGLGGE